MNINQDNIGNFVEESVRENLIIHYEKMNYMNVLLDFPRDGGDNIQDFIDWTVSFNPLVLDLFILDGEGRVISTSGRNAAKLGTDYSPYNFFTEPEDDLSLWGQPVISSATSTVSYVLSLKRPDHLCFVIFYSFDGIQRLLEKLSTPSTSLGVLSVDLFFMAHTDYSFVEKRLQDQSIDFGRTLQAVKTPDGFKLAQWSHIGEYNVYMLISFYNRKQLSRLQQDLEELISVADGINRGDYELKIRRFRYRELSRLADSFNRLTGTLKMPSHPFPSCS